MNIPYIYRQEVVHERFSDCLLRILTARYACSFQQITDRDRKAVHSFTKTMSSVSSAGVTLVRYRLPAGSCRSLIIF